MLRAWHDAAAATGTIMQLTVAGQRVAQTTAVAARLREVSLLIVRRNLVRGHRSRGNRRRRGAAGTAFALVPSQASEIRRTLLRPKRKTTSE